MGARFPHRPTVLRGRRRHRLSILAAVAALLALAFGGGNAKTAIYPQDFAEMALFVQSGYSGDSGPVVPMDASPGGESTAVRRKADGYRAGPNESPQIEATPTPAVAIAPTMVAVAASTPALPLQASGLENCPAVIVETFGEQAPQACAVAWCESKWNPHAVGDGGNSLGMFQLWTGWAAWYGVSVDALFDAATNAAVARAVLEYRGRWGGRGGWTCADWLGIP